MFQNILQTMLQGNNPMMQMFNSMMKGQTPRQQIKTLIKRAQAQGFDVNKKCFSQDDLRRLGL